MRFPRDLLRFILWIYFKPRSFHTLIDGLDPALENGLALFMYSRDGVTQSLKNLALFYILIVPWLLGMGTGAVLALSGMDVNWLKLAFYLFIATAVSSTFRIDFWIAFLLPFSIMIALWSSIPFTLPLGIIFSLTLGLAYGLGSNNAGWGAVASLVYGVLSGLVLGPLGGLSIGAAFLAGYFRIVFYLLEAPLSWTLAGLASRRDALRLWKVHPVRWDEMIWLPLPGLDRHLRALLQQNRPAAQDAIRTVSESVRQRWAAERVSAHAEFQTPG